MPLVLATVLVEDAEHVHEGILHCSDAACQLEYPIIDGAPILVPQIRTYVADNFFHLTMRDNLSDTIESMLGDGAGPGAFFDVTRQHLSTYAWDAYADLDPAEQVAEHEPGAIVRCLEQGLDLIGAQPQGPVIDIGCSVGRSTFALAAHCDQAVLGVDIGFSMLGLARRILANGVVRYPRRRVGIVYDRREFAVEFAGSERVDFWICDAMALPFSRQTFALAVGLNVLDCVASPRDFLASLGTLLQAGGHALLTTPYDWSSSATPLEAWIGGHSQRAAGNGASEPFLRTLLTPGAHPQSISNLRIVGEKDDIPWHARLHERSTVTYKAHMLVAQAAKSD